MLLLSVVLASKGDREKGYRQCLAKCTDTMDLPLWTPHEKCQYACMWERVEKRTAKEQKIHQYHGKWPFYRMWVVQEPLSMLFSLGNMAVGLWYLPSVQWRWPLGPDVTFVMAWHIITWGASASLHTVSRPITEYFDYFTAGFLVVYGLYLFLRHLARISRLWLIPMLGLYLWYVNYQISRPGLDYGLHMMVFSILGALHNVAWFLYALYTRESHTLKAGLAGMATLVCLALFEWLDFAIIGYMDAHCIWHLCTWILSPCWIDFWLVEQRKAKAIKSE